MNCATCGSALPTATQYGWCAIEGTCLTHCSDFVGHCSPVPEQEREQAAMALDLERVERGLTLPSEQARAGDWPVDEIGEW